MASHLNDKVQGWAKTHSPVYIISGVVLDANNDGQRDPDGTYPRYSVHIDIGCDITYIHMLRHRYTDEYFSCECGQSFSQYMQASKAETSCFMCILLFICYICTCSAALKFS